MLLSLSWLAALALEAESAESILGKVMQMAALNKVMSKQSNKSIFLFVSELK